MKRSKYAMIVVERVTGSEREKLVVVNEVMSLFSLNNQLISFSRMSDTEGWHIFTIKEGRDSNAAILAVSTVNSLIVDSLDTITNMVICLLSAVHCLEVRGRE